MKRLQKNQKPEISQSFYDLLNQYQLLKPETVSEENILAIYPKIADTYEKYRNKTPKQRFVDFNQGTDCRYVTDEKMKLLSEIPIRPLRIAFDYIGIKKQYVEAVRLAHKYGIKELSNYILYNFNDKPEEFYERIKINVELCKEYDLHIYSFPMKYIPLFGEESKNRDYIGKYWNKKFIRAIQSVLNVTKGIVAPAHKNEKTSFFEKAFGRDLNEFFEILYMPETYIVYRKVFEELGYTQEWLKLYHSLNEKEKKEAQKIIEKNDFKNIEKKTKNPKIRALLKHYTITREDVKNQDAEYEQLKIKFDKLIKKEVYLDRTLTFDFDRG